MIAKARRPSKTALHADPAEALHKSTSGWARTEEENGAGPISEGRTFHLLPDSRMTKKHFDPKSWLAHEVLPRQQLCARSAVRSTSKRICRATCQKFKRNSGNCWNLMKWCLLSFGKFGPAISVSKERRAPKLLGGTAVGQSLSSTVQNTGGQGTSSEVHGCSKAHHASTQQCQLHATYRNATSNRIQRNQTTQVNVQWK